MARTTDIPHPVLLLHGWTGSREDFAAVIPALERERDVVAPDLPGHGSQPPPADGDYSLSAHVQWLRRLLATHDVDALHVVGHSHGGLVAQWLAFAMPASITSLTLVGTGPGAPADHTTDMIRAVAIALRDEGKQAAWDLLRAAAEPEDPADLREALVRRRFFAMPDAAVIGVARNLLTAAPLGAFLYGIDFPVLVCHGEGDDAWLPAQQQQLARRIPGSQYAVIPRSDHVPTVENPDGFLDLFVPFLAAHDA